MGFMTEKIPYSLELGLDLSNYGDLILNENLTYDLIIKIEENKLDYIMTTISKSNQTLRRDSLSNFTEPIFIDDYSLFAHEWKNKFVGVLHSEDLKEIDKNSELIKIDLDYMYHINTKSIVVDLNNYNKENKFLIGKIIKKYLLDNTDRFINVIVKFSKEGLNQWQIIQSELGYLDNLGVIAEIEPNLPEEEILIQFTSHNIKAILLPFSIFVTNKSGYPVLSKVHQDYIKYFMGYKVDVIFKDDTETLIKNENGKINLNEFSVIKNYYLYITHLFTTHREFKSVDYVLFNYLDTFQIPLQPLRDNLQSQTYECFEEDNVKYESYEMAVFKALENYKTKGYLSLENIKKNNTEMYIENKTNHVNDSNRVLIACVVGGGRGPLVRKVIKAAVKQGFIIGYNFKVICVEKNRNAFNTLLNRKLKEPEVFGNVDLIFSDMRDFNPNYKIDIVVSELLGSFGDNELSPECLIPLQKYLNDDSIMVPHSYSSYLRPVSCPVVWAEIKKIKENYQSPYVILLHKAFYPIKEVQECFTFTHPVAIQNLNLIKSTTFKFDQSVVIHGFAGYFNTVLYDDVTLSTLPYDHTPNMFSWFPIYFPTQNPIEINLNQELSINIVRENDGKKVWYEWNFEILKENQSEVSSHFIHNLGGGHYSILL